MSRMNKGPKILGNFGFSDLNLNQQQEVITAVRKGATRRDIMTWMMAAGASATTGGAIFTSASAPYNIDGFMRCDGAGRA